MYVLPLLQKAGWTDEQIAEQRMFTDGRIVVVGDKCWRGKQKRADYILRRKLSKSKRALTYSEFFKSPPC